MEQSKHASLSLYQRLVFLLSTSQVRLLFFLFHVRFDYNSKCGALFPPFQRCKGEEMEDSGQHSGGKGGKAVVDLVHRLVLAIVRDASPQRALSLTQFGLRVLSSRVLPSVSQRDEWGLAQLVQKKRTFFCFVFDGL